MFETLFLGGGVQWRKCVQRLPKVYIAESLSEGVPLSSYLLLSLVTGVKYVFMVFMCAFFLVNQEESRSWE